VDPEARETLRKSGCRVKDELVKVPRHLCQQALQTAPKGFTIYNRLGERAMILEGRKTYFGSSTGSPNTLDPLTGEVRPTTLADIAAGALITDALPNIDFAMPMGSAQDIQPPLAVELHEFEAMVANTSKPLVMLSYSERAFELVYEMAAVVAGGWDELKEKPFLLAYPEPITPLVFPRECTQRIMKVARWGLPQIFGPVAQLGTTGPITLAGALAQAVAEAMICLTLAQITQAGAPCFLSIGTPAFDMKVGAVSICSPENNLGKAAAAEIAQYFGLPSWGAAGVTDAKILDAQAGVESALGLLSQALAGLSLVHDVGYMDGSMICSPEMLVLGNEVIGMVERFTRGIVVNEDTLQRDLIAKVCPGGNYLQQRHTAMNLRSELWLPKLMTRDRYAAWQEKGSKDIRTRIREEIRHILETHKAAPLPDDIRAALAEIKQAGNKELMGS
jgi:trimethylamine---corrinoid protein Co-methyltransferase